MSGHTPGPWRKLDGHYNAGCIMGAHGGVVSDDPNCSLADAQLMAAAPDLLAALKMAVDTPWKDGWVAIAHAAIAKAEGR